MSVVTNVGNPVYTSQVDFDQNLAAWQPRWESRLHLPGRLLMCRFSCCLQRKGAHQKLEECGRHTRDGGPEGFSEPCHVNSAICSGGASGGT